MATRSSTVLRLATAAGADLVGADGDVTGIAYDSREVRAGDLFACLPGGYADGHDFARDAVARGASALMTERPLELGVPELLVPSVRRCLAPVAASFYGEPSRRLTVVGITGTDGKTTTSYILDHILRSTGLVTGMVGTVSVRIADKIVEHETRQTTPESSDVQRLLRQMVDSRVSHAIVEATSHGLSLHRLDNVRFRVAAVTNITSEHLEHHGTVEAYRAAKGSLFDRVGQSGGAAVVNLDDDGARSMLAWSEGASAITYSTLDPAATLRASQIRPLPAGTRFTISFGDASWDVELPLIGQFNVSNALCAVGIALHCGVDATMAVAALRDTPQIPGRMQFVDPWRPVKTIVDYAHTPASLEAMMRMIRESNPNGRLIAVFGSAGERDVAKRSQQGAVAARLADLAVFTNEDPREEDERMILAGIAEGARSEGWTEGEQYWVVPDRRLAIRQAVSMAETGDVLLLAGKGHERSIIIGQRKTPWDEPAVAAEELACRFGDAP